MAISEEETSTVEGSTNQIDDRIVCREMWVKTYMLIRVKALRLFSLQS